ncbi:MAG: heat shock protein HspQ [Verrucomicrobia bacterium]|nr:heat shock protein HspQ [Verrucomicrobiota bacterium]MDA1086267.1 heat shock protein HspQ [Verrucomicrobiota bacterium]
MIQFSREYSDLIAHPTFKPGDIVHHRRYGYRGVVVDLDEECQASEEWHSANQTQPDRRQAWYHVLVDGGTQTTYVAQQNLEPDSTQAPVYHPLVEYFFTQYEDGHYTRNDRPWGSIGLA